jgi:hypothetical protein
MGFIDGQRHRSYLGRRGLEASADTTPSSTVDAQHRSCCGGSATGGTNRRKPGQRPARVRAGLGAAARGSARPEAATMARAAGDLAAAAAAARGSDAAAAEGAPRFTWGREEEEEEGEVAAASGACEGEGRRYRGGGGGNGGRR